MEDGAFGVVPGQAHETDWPHLLLPQLGRKTGKLEPIPATHAPHLDAGFL